MVEVGTFAFKAVEAKKAYDLQLLLWLLESLWF